MPGTPLPSFADFAALTGPNFLGDPERIINDAALLSYNTIFGKGLAGRDAATVVRSGSPIKFATILSVGTNGRFQNPNEVHTPVIGAGVVNGSAYWRFFINNWGWTEQEIDLNQGEPAKTMYARLATEKRQLCYTDTFNQVEQECWAAPVSADCETSTGTRPYPIRAFITEAGTMPTLADGATVAFTTVEGIADQTNWRNKTASYTASSWQTTLLPAFDSMFFQTHFTAPAQHAENFKPDTNSAKQRILTDLTGINRYTHVTRNSNDRMVVPNDPGTFAGDSMFHSRPVEYIPAIDTQIAYANPRYFWINYDYLYPVVHPLHYLKEHAPHQLTAVGQPESWVVYSTLWYNWVCTSRKSQGIIISA